jgi:hypothetical protein
MHRRFAALVALLLVTTLAACQAVAPVPLEDGPNDTPTPTPVPTPVTAWTTFTSERYSYAIDIPADWEAREGAGTPNIPKLRPFTGGSDMLASLETHRFQHRHGLQVASVEVDPDQALDEFTSSVHMPCGGPGAHEEATLDGEPAIHRTFRCDGNHPVYLQVTAFHEGRGYVLWFMTIEPPEAPVRAEYLAMLESFRFTDAATATEDGS